MTPFDHSRVGAITPPSVGLERTQAHLEHLLGCMSVAVYSIDPATQRMTAIDGNIEELSGYTSERFRNDPQFWHDQLHPEDAAMFRGHLTSLRENGRHAIEYRFRHRDGQYRWFRDEARLLSLDAAGPAVLVGTIVDITANRAREQELRKLSRAVEQSPTSILITDIEGAIE